VALAKLETENITGQMKAADLAPAVAEDFVGAYAATDDFVDELGRLTFAENSALRG